MSQNIDKSMAYIMNESGGDFQKGGCLYKPTSGIQWTSKHSWTSDRPQKRASEKADWSKFGSGVVVISQFIDEAINVVMENILCHCVCMQQVLAKPVTIVVLISQSDN